MPTTPAKLISPEELTKPTKLRARNWRHPDVDVRGLWKELRKSVEGEVRFDPGSIAMYSLDGGNYQHFPIGVVIPKSLEDVVETVKASRKFGAPLLSRAGGTSLCGQTCSYAIVIDWSKYLNHILEINPREKYASVLPGVVCDDVVFATQAYRLTYGPDPATHNHCCFGGMLGNNSCGVHAQMAGKAVDNTEEMEILLYDGTRMTVGWMTDSEMDAKIAAGGCEGAIYAKLRSLRSRYGKLVEQNYPDIPRRVSGYNLDQLIPGKNGRFNVARALVGSEGTCVVMLKAKVRLVYSHPKRALLVLGYPDVYHAADDIMEVLEYKPIGLEGVDEVLHNNIEKKGGPARHYLSSLPEGKGWLLVEFGAGTPEDATAQAEALMARLKHGLRSPTMKLVTDEGEQKKIWKVRESGLGATAFVPGEPITWEGWEDSAVHPKFLTGYLKDLRALYQKYDYNSALYGHFGMGCVHCRVSFDFFTKPGIQKYKAFMDDATDLVVKYGGSISGEHGDGQSKAQFLYKMFGKELVEGFREFKSIWDPGWKLNPGKIVDPYHIDEHLRLGANYDPWEPKTHFAWPNDHGSFAHATLRCVGVGKCRRLNGEGEDDVMCPSFMVTREERHSTRGRAHLLWQMLNAGPIKKGWRDENVKEALDLCLSCKGCKGDCPVNVDIATYKAEFLSHYYAGRIRPRQAYAFGLIDQWSRVASLAPGFVNLFTQLPGLSNVAKFLAGMPQQRHIPPFAAYTFKSWFRKHVARESDKPKVILFGDTFNNYFFPETAQAAVDVLQDAGYQLMVSMEHLCCGRPLYDYGFLDTARTYLNKILSTLETEIEAGTPMVVLEPSCASVFRDELNDLMPNHPLARKLVSQTFLLGEFLEKAKYKPPQLHRKAIIQGHCHHKSIMRFKSEEKLLSQMDLDYKMLASGCCGMAGSFGYEKGEKYKVSIAAGERVLLPKVRLADTSTIIMADGFSCKEQIEQETDRHALHLAEVIKMAIDHGAYGVRGTYPEKDLVDQRQNSLRGSMLRAGLAAAALCAGAFLGWKFLNKRTSISEHEKQVAA